MRLDESRRMLRSDYIRRRSKYEAELHIDVDSLITQGRECAKALGLDDRYLEKPKLEVDEVRGKKKDIGLR